MSSFQEKELLGFIQSKQFATVSELSEKLFLSQSSIRRKLAVLEEKGLVKRVHGGVKVTETNNLFPTFTFRSHQNSIEKKKIALNASKMIHDGDVVFLDGSTSVFFVAEYLKDLKNVRIITNGIDTLSLLSKNNVNGYSTGGKISQSNRSVLIGQNAINTVSNYHADIAFFSAQSIRRDGEIFDCFEEENYVRLAMMKNSTKKIFLCDTTKFGKTSPYRLCNINDIDLIITNSTIDEYLNKEFLKKVIYV